ncbi:hypothetical protein QF038_001846 [Pseudarthrobacter sp. W1I19]|uniref:hypothetical protein n=1 Tax=Pseudarthrobacter sp. W1I19 TaxID=3042288 RepID=UPI002782F98A|nr:hypothetical protein [Pseudarthrobacter sp. W1I19]MDQ0923338.1 hypothetical protein [Pseudarthrobacter sp. W1I19]
MAFVQSAKYATPGGGGSTGNAVLGASPTPGNYLVASYIFWNSLTPTTPTGFTVLDQYNTTNGGAVGIKTYYRVVQAGDSATIAATMSASDDWSFVVAEFSGIGGVESYVNHTQALGTATTLASSAVTPTHLNDQFLAIFGQQAGTVNGATDSLPAGWTIDQTARSDFNSGIIGHKDSLTSDTTTAISVIDTTTAQGGTRDKGSTIIVLYPTVMTGAYIPARIPNRKVGPMALRRKWRQPSWQSYAMSDSAQSISPTGIPSTAAIGSPAVSPGAVDISAAAIGASASFGTPTVSPGPVAITVTGIASTALMGSPAVSPGPVNISASGNGSALSLGSPTLSPGAVSVPPTGVASTAAVGAPTLSPGSVAISTTGVASGSAVGTPVLTPGASDVSPTGVASTVTIGSPTLSPGAASASPAGVGSTASIGSPSLSSAATLQPTSIDSTAALGSPTLTSSASLIPSGIASTLSLGSPTVALVDSLVVTPSGIVSTAAIGSPTLVPGPAAVTPAGIASTATIGSASLEPGGVTIAATGILSTASIGTPTLIAGDVNLALTGIESSLGIGSAILTLAGGFQAEADITILPVEDYGAVTAVNEAATSLGMGDDPTVTRLGGDDVTVL